MSVPSPDTGSKFILAAGNSPHLEPNFSSCMSAGTFMKIRVMSVPADMQQGGI